MKKFLILLTLLPHLALAGGVGAGATAFDAEQFTAGKAVRNPYYNAIDAGAKNDGRYLRDVTCTSGSAAISSATGAFTSADVGKTFVLHVTSTTNVVRTVASVQSATAATLSATVSASRTNATAILGSDNSATVQALITTIYNAGGGTAYFPGGIYVFSGALQDTGARNGVLVWPNNASGRYTIGFEGTTQPQTLYNDFATDPAPVSAGSTMFYCATVGSGTTPSFISAGIRMRADFRNIVFRTPVNPTLGVLNFATAANGLVIDSCTFDVDFENYSTFPVPTNTNAAITFPVSGNDSWNSLSHAVVTGYYYGVKSSEHDLIFDSNIFDNAVGLFISDGTGPTLTKVHLLENVHQIAIDPVASDPRIHAYGLEIESPQGVGGNNNFNPTYALYDPRVNHNLNGLIQGVMTAPGGTTSTFHGNFDSSYLTVDLSEDENTSMIKRRRINAAIDPSVQATLQMGDDNALAGMPGGGEGIKIGHATRASGIAMVSAASIGALMTTTPGGHVQFGGIRFGAYDSSSPLTEIDPGGAGAYFGGVIGTSAAAPTIASAATVAPVKAITFISGTTTINTITVPAAVSGRGGHVTLIPTGLWSTGTSGNIAIATTAVVSKALILTYDGTTSKWYPSY